MVETASNGTHGERTKAAIIAAGLQLWRERAGHVTARRIGAALDMTHSAILYHFGTSEGLKAAIAAEAVKIGDVVIVPQLIVANHPAASTLSEVERRGFLSRC